MEVIETQSYRKFFLVRLKLKRKHKRKTIITCSVRNNTRKHNFTGYFSSQNFSNKRLFLLYICSQDHVMLYFISWQKFSYLIKFNEDLLIRFCFLNYYLTRNENSYLCTYLICNERVRTDIFNYYYQICRTHVFWIIM